MKEFVNKTEFYVDDENIVMYLFNEDEERIAIDDLTIEEAEGYIKYLQIAIEKAKKSEDGKIEEVA